MIWCVISWTGCFRTWRLTTVLEPPDIAPATLAARLLAEYDLRASDVEFLPLGADVNTAVYRVTADDGAAYFLKLRRGDFDIATVAIPHLLHSRGNSHIIPPILTREGQVCTRLDRFAVILSPFVAGHDAYDVPLSPGQWREFGSALHGLHAADLPPVLRGGIPAESYSPEWRNMVRRYQDIVERTTFSEPVAAETAAFLRSQRAVITDVLVRADRLGAELVAHPLLSVLCHGDIHAWNLLIRQDGALYIVDWDTLVYAPKERDLMFVGAGLGGIWRTPEEVGWFYEGYGPAEVNPVALAYFRYERILQDIAAFAEQLLESDAGGADRPQSLHYLMSSFEPGQTIEVAYAADQSSTDVSSAYCM